MVTRHSCSTVSPPMPESKTPTGRGSIGWSLGVGPTGPLVPRAGVVARLVAGRREQLRGNGRAAAGVAVDDELCPGRQADELPQLLRRPLEELRELEVPRAGDVALTLATCVARLAGVLLR